MGYVDWEFAKTTGRALVSAGPTLSRDEAEAEVEAIRSAARAAREPVAATAEMQTPDGAPDALVVDRATWIGLNTDSMGAMLDPAFERIMAGREQQPNAAVQAIGSKVTGAEAGALLAFMASKVLGQYDLAPGGTPRLMLVAPNLVAVATDLGVDRDDFRAWVCMHEETHRVQFTATPWLRDHLVEQARSLAVDLAPDQEGLGDLATRVMEKLPDLFKEGKGVVAEGKLGADGVFHASQVLAKHDENYMPPEAAEALKNAAAHKEQSTATLSMPPTNAAGAKP